ncbi:MAG TPA: carboxymuconolactone decarboxylase family protein [Dehalococcoidia bacterium]|nr:carboxymuconolactone decarboxylase family protein [Dehalococcoidia bacterium]
MPRLRQVPRDDASDEVAATYRAIFGERDPVAEPGTVTGTPGNWWTVFALVPEILAQCQAGFALFNSKERRLQPRLRELALIRAGFGAESQFVFSQHAKAARAAGVSAEQLRDLPAWTVSDAFDEPERAVLAYTDQVIIERGRVQDGVFARLREHLTDEAILELTYLIGTYGMHATICRALRLEYDDIDERVREVPMPARGASGSAGS